MNEIVKELYDDFKVGFIWTITFILIAAIAIILFPITIFIIIGSIVKDSQEEYEELQRDLEELEKLEKERTM